MTTTFFDIYSKTNHCKKFHLTIHRQGGEVEVKNYTSFKDVYHAILVDISPDEMMRLEVVGQKAEDSNIYLELVEHPENLKFN